MTARAVTSTRLSLFGFFVVVVLTALCYRPALHGTFQLDDRANLGGLADVRDLSTGLDFVLSGEAGPTGRPLALLTFALQAGHWEQGAAAFLRVNVLLHLLNALLVFGCFYQLSRLRETDKPDAVLLACAAAAVWAIMPLHATASLLVVQRMTTLSAMFVCLGLLGYLSARRSIETRPRRALTGMTVSLVAGTALATLSKESGLLLPVLVLVAEATLLEVPQRLRRGRWRAWQGVFLLLPLAVIAAYLASRAVYPDWMIAKRDFTVGERLLTEARVLWIYLYKAVLGLPGTRGGYQTAPGISRSLLQVTTLLASLAWLALAAVAVVWRRRWPLLSFAVLWYLAAHLLESSVLPLEVYFEYRNYVPMIGPVYALLAWLLSGALLRHAAAFILPVYILASAYFLYTFASMSGDPSASSRYWALRYPDSVRAVTTMALYQLDEEGPIRALSTIDRFVIAEPQHAYLRIQELNIRCMILPDEDHTAVLQELQRELPAIEFTYSAAGMLRQLLGTVVSVDCNGVDADTVAAAAEALRSNPRYAVNPGFRQFHFRLLAEIAQRQGDVDGSIGYLRQAVAERPARDLNRLMVVTLARQGELEAAAAFIDDALLQSPRSPLRALLWRRELQKLRDYITELERYSDSPE